MGKEGMKCSFDVLSSNSAPPASYQMGVESQCPEWQESVLAGTGAAFRLEGTTPLPVWTFEIIYCCYFFSPLTLGQKAPRLCPSSILLVALGMRTDTPTSGWAALSSPCYIPRPWFIGCPCTLPPYLFTDKNPTLALLWTAASVCLPLSFIGVQRGFPPVPLSHEQLPQALDLLWVQPWSFANTTGGGGT